MELFIYWWVGTFVQTCFVNYNFTTLILLLFVRFYLSLLSDLSSLIPNHLSAFFLCLIFVFRSRSSSHLLAKLLCLSL